MASQMAESGGGGADAQRHGDNGGEGEAGGVAQRCARP